MRQTRSEILEVLSPIFRKVFNNNKLIISESSDSQSIENWDSLANIKLLVTVEIELKIRFRTSDITGLANVGELISIIQTMQDENDYV
jgi:acyl carrier protein